MKSNKLISIMLLGVLGIGIWYWVSFSRDASKLLALYGNVDIREVNLAFRVPGRILEVYKDEGDSVKAGEIVARIDPEPYQRQVEEAQAQLDSLQADYDRLKRGNRKEDIEQARASVEELNASLADAQSDYERDNKLVGKQVISQQDFINASARLLEVRSRLASAKQQLLKQETGYRPEEINKGKAEVEKATASLNMAKIQLSDTELRAPNDGTILTRALEPGAIVQTGTTVLTLSLDKPVWVRAYVDQPNLGHVVPGKSVTVHSDAKPSQPYKGKIGFVSSRAEFTPKSVESPELRTSLVYRLRIVVPNPDNMLRQGMPVTVYVIKEG